MASVKGFERGQYFSPDRPQEGTGQAQVEEGEAFLLEPNTNTNTDTNADFPPDRPHRGTGRGGIFIIGACKVHLSPPSVNNLDVV